MSRDYVSRYSPEAAAVLARNPGRRRAPPVAVDPQLCACGRSACVGRHNGGGRGIRDGALIVWTCAVCRAAGRGG